MRTPFLIIGLQRSGTTLVHQTLKLHPNISTIPHEIRTAFFTKGAVDFVAMSRERKKEIGDRFNRAAFFALAEMYNEQPDIRALGAKIALNRGEDLKALFDAVLHLIPEMRLVRVVREDEVARYASLLRAAKTGQWASVERNRSGGEASGPMTIDTEDFRSEAISSRLIRFRLERLMEGREHVEIGYEKELATNPEEGLSRVQQFLEVPVHPVSPELKKQAPPLEQFVTNVEALREVERQVEQLDESTCERQLKEMLPKRSRQPVGRLKRAIRGLVGR